MVGSGCVRHGCSVVIPAVAAANVAAGAFAVAVITAAVS